MHNSKTEKYSDRDNRKTQDRKSHHSKSRSYDNYYGENERKHSESRSASSSPRYNEDRYGREERRASSNERSNRESKDSRSPYKEEYHSKRERSSFHKERENRPYSYDRRESSSRSNDNRYSDKYDNDRSRRDEQSYSYKQSERRDVRSESRSSYDNRSEYRDSRDGHLGYRDSRDNRSEGHNSRDNRSEYRNSSNSRNNHSESRDTRSSRDNYSEYRDYRDNRSENRSSYDTRSDYRGSRDMRDSRDNRSDYNRDEQRESRPSRYDERDRRPYDEAKESKPRYTEDRYKREDRYSRNEDRKSPREDRKSYSETRRSHTDDRAFIPKEAHYRNNERHFSESSSNRLSATNSDRKNRFNEKPKSLLKESEQGYAKFLPMNRADMRERGWDELDILLIFGDSYIDHPSFASSLLGRYLEHHGFKVGIITQPDWRDPHIIEKIQEMGRPRLFAGISAGAVDSMLAHYTAFRKKRHDDAYTPGGKCGARPNRAIMVYASLVKQAFPQLPLIGGGIEASLRRLSHYDFWSDSLRKSLLPDAKLDLLLYGMGERAILEVARRLNRFYEENPDLQWTKERNKYLKKPWQEALKGIAGTARIIRNSEIADLDPKTIILPSHRDIERNPKLLIEATLLAEQHIHHSLYPAVQSFDEERAVLMEKNAKPLLEHEMDILYSLPYMRQAHPRYKGHIPAETMMKTSMTCHRGCGGGCSFCSLALHQSRHISSRSNASLLQEARKIAKSKGFDGSISDVGGPSANMWQGYCAGNSETCKRSSCMTPNICNFFKVDQEKHLNLLENIKKIPNIRHVRVASGVRFDLALTQSKALEKYTSDFTGGQLKVAPEHCSSEVLKLMRKPQMDSFEIFLQSFYGYCKKMGKEQYVVPYLLSAFPGCSDEHMRELASWLAKRHWKPQQVQCFIPTPGTVATAMFYAECDTKGNPLFVAKSDAQRLRQHGILLGTAVNPNDDMFQK